VKLFQHLISLREPGQQALEHTFVVIGELRLDYEQRQKRRARFVISSGAAAGETIGLDLPRGHSLGDGDLLLDETKTQAVRVACATEQLLQLEGQSATHTARLAYHLGNRHVPLEILQQNSQTLLRIQLDHVLEQMAMGLGAKVWVVNAPFNPESGAYHSHAHTDSSAGNNSSAGVHPAANAHHALASATSSLASLHDAQHGGSQAGAQFDRRHNPIIHDFLDPASPPVKR
jgi:urease accessory protein